MGKSYGHVTIEERCEIARLQASGYSVSQIAASLDRSPSTGARELKRNGSKTQGYQPRYADQQAHARRWRGSRLERDEALRDKVLSGLKQGWSPEQVAGRMAMESGDTVISHESIYSSSTARLLVRRTTAGATTWPELSRSGVGEATKAAALLPSWLSVVPSPSARRALLTAALLVTGRPT